MIHFHQSDELSLIRPMLIIVIDAHQKDKYLSKWYPISFADSWLFSLSNFWLFIKRMKFHKNDELSSKWWIFIKLMIFFDQRDEISLGWWILMMKWWIEIMNVRQCDNLTKKTWIFIRVLKLHQIADLPKWQLFLSWSWTFIRMMSHYQRDWF